MMTQDSSFYSIISHGHSFLGHGNATMPYQAQQHYCRP